VLWRYELIDIVIHQVHPVKLALDIGTASPRAWLLAGALIVAAGWPHRALFDPISTDR
jgi:hypothetical protein